MYIARARGANATPVLKGYIEDTQLPAPVLTCREMPTKQPSMLIACPSAWDLSTKGGWRRVPWQRQASIKMLSLFSDSFGSQSISVDLHNDLFQPCNQGYSHTTVHVHATTKGKG